MLSQEDGATAIGKKTEDFMRFGHDVLVIRERTDTQPYQQTYRHAYCNTSHSYLGWSKNAVNSRHSKVLTFLSLDSGTCSSFLTVCISVMLPMVDFRYLQNNTITRRCQNAHYLQSNQTTNILIMNVVQHNHKCLQCFDTVGWAAGRASGLQKLSGEVLG